ncbi:MAG: UspA domain protein [Marmoricola sp.]|nr:UspA domain protein [Marmoricola sp.]
MNHTAGTIVVGVDGSEQSERALTWAVELATAERRSLTLVHAINDVMSAYPQAPIAAPGEARDALRAAGHDLLRQAHAAVGRLDPELVVHEVFRLDDPRAVLLELSRDAHMVVVGSRGRGKVRSLLLGSVGVALVRHAECPVVVHRPGNAGTVCNGVLVGADSSPESLAVLRFAYQQASLRDLPLTVLHCYRDVPALAYDRYVVPPLVIDVESERLGLAESMAGFAEKYPDVRVRTEIINDAPQDAMVKLGERMNLVVIGSHQSGPVSQMLFGMVSVSVVEHAICPVAVLPLAAPS